MAGTISQVEKISIWELCDILEYNAIIADQQREAMEKIKHKRK
jgi:hypothetical protein